MNGKGHLTLRATKDKKWILEAVEKRAQEKERSINFIVFEILEKAFKKAKK